MRLIIDGHEAALPDDFSFELQMENRQFSGADAFSLTITLPLAGSPKNTYIFGHLYRKDIIKSVRNEDTDPHITFPCQIYTDTISLFGAVAVTEITEKNIKLQFLQGRSAQNYDRSLDNIFINELDLGAPTAEEIAATGLPRWKYASWPEGSDIFVAVPIPWVNANTGIIQNRQDDNDPLNQWHRDCRGLSYMPYFTCLFKRICNRAGFRDVDISEWEATPDRFLLVCNALPAVWDTPQYAAALPHWSVGEFFAQVERLLNATITIDFEAKKIKFRYNRNEIGELHAQPVELAEVVDTHNTALSRDKENGQFVGQKNIRYADCDHEMWKYYACDWFIKKAEREGRIQYYPTFEALADATREFKTTSFQFGRFLPNTTDLRAAEKTVQLYNQDHPDAPTTLEEEFPNRMLTPLAEKVLCVDNEDGRAYFALFTADRSEFPDFYRCRNRLQRLNEFGGRIVDESENASSEEIKIVPAWIDETEAQQWMPFLPLGSYDEGTDPEEDPNDRPKDLHQSDQIEQLILGERTGRHEYYDKLYVAYYDGGARANQHPNPMVYGRYDINDNFDIVQVGGSGYIDGFPYLNLARRYSEGLPQIDSASKTTFQWIHRGAQLPDPRSIFIIAGHRYLCEKYTANFNSTGLNPLLKGTFYPILDT